MALVKVRGHEFNLITIKDSFNRRAQKYKNNIIENLKTIGLTEDDIYIDLEPMAIKRLPASASWYLDGHHLYYSYRLSTKYVENLYVVSKIIEFEINAIKNGEKSIDQFILDFAEKHDVEEERKIARDLLGIEENSTDLDKINKTYKNLAKDLHPDMPNGDLEKFKAINNAHKILKKELQ